MKKNIYVLPRIKCRTMDEALMAATSLPINSDPTAPVVTEDQQLSKENNSLNLWSDSPDSDFE